jgi:hypothetical protein
MEYHYKLRNWISEDKLNIKMLCSNPHPGIVPILEKHIDKINNDTLLKYKDNYDWDDYKTMLEILCENPFAISFLEKYMDTFDKGEWSFYHLIQQHFLFSKKILKKYVYHP